MMGNYVNAFFDCFKRIYVPCNCRKLMEAELDDALRALLVAQTASDYADSAVEYNEKRIARLKFNLKEEKNENSY